MESVMNFLADYYIWFFVGALVLCFALIGFIIDARKKKKNEFKGEEIATSTNTTENVQTPTSTEPQVVGTTVEVGGEATLGTQNTVSDSTMEINDIPIAPTSPVAPETKVEFYSGPVEMPTAEPAPMNTPNPEPTSTVTIGEPISFDNTASSVAEPVVPVQPVQGTVSTPQPENTNNQNNIN